MFSRHYDWTKFKEFVIQRQAFLQYFEEDNQYILWASDGPVEVTCAIFKTDPASLDQVDFEDNYKANGNQKLSAPRDASGHVIFAVKDIHPVYAFLNLLRPSNQTRDMNVSGSLATPVHFEFKPQAGDIWHVEKLVFGMDDVGLTDMGLFGGISMLANGLLITVRTKGQIHTIGNIRDNVDVAMIFEGQTLGQSGVLDTADGMYGSLTFHNQIHLIGDLDDYIRIAVRDNLTAINILRSMVVARKVL